jgi:hypothetical protein
MRCWNLKSKKITRSIRISLDLDEQVEQHQKYVGSDSYTQAILHLVMLGLQATKFKLEIKENPEKEQEIRKSYDSMLEKLTDEKIMSTSFGELSSNELVALKEMIAIEDDAREKNRINDEEQERKRNQEENLRRKEHNFY